MGNIGKKFATPSKRDWVLPIVPALAILTYWIMNWLQGESLSVAAMYRYGDYQLFPAIAALAHFSWGEWLVAERFGEGLLSIPLPGMALHGLAFGVLGPIGLVVADLLLAICTYLASCRLLRTCGIHSPTSEVLALVVSCGLLGGGPTLADDLMFWTVKVHLWGFRIPRPFVTDLLLLLCVDQGLRVFVLRRDAAREWALLGFWFGLLLQCNFFAATTVGLGLGFGLADRARRGWPVAQVMRSMCSLTLVTAVTALPFILQRLLEHPDVPVRLGSFPVPRLSPLYLGPEVIMDFTREIAPAVTTAALAGAVIKWRGTAERRERLGGLLVVTLLCVLSTFALPASTIVLGRTAQPYHFLLELITFTTLLLLVATGHLIQAASSAVISRSTISPANRARLRVALLTTCALACLAIAIGIHLPSVQRTDHFRMDLYFRTESQANRAQNYRSAFRDVTEILEQSRKRGARVLGTLDIQVHAWWSLFGGGQVFSPDPCGTTVSDDEIEERFLRLLRTLGATTDDVGRLVQSRAMQIFFLSHNKYQFSQAYSTAPLLDYLVDYPATEIQSLYDSTSVFSSWTIVVPPSEVRRILGRYNLTQAVGEDRQLDLIVLGRGPLDNSLAPSPERFDLVFENDLFRVYERSHPREN